MEKTEKHVIWQPNEEIYKAGDNPEGAYLIKSGYVYIYTSGGLKLNSCLLYTSPSPRDS